MIKIFTDKSYTNQNYRRVIFPILLDLFFHKNANLLKIYTFVATLEESDIAIVPVEIGYLFNSKQRDKLDLFIDNATALGKAIWIYTAGDIGITLKKDVFHFRFGGFESKFNDKTFIFPAFIEDPYNDFEQDFSAIKKEQYPKIGFVGHANGSITKQAKEFLSYLKTNVWRLFNLTFADYQPFFPSSVIRHKLLNILMKNDLIDTDFIFRNKYRAGYSTENEKIETTKVFFQNIYKNPYTFCIRGAGNFSVRLYETLAMGRIPVVVDTDFRLPLHTNIDWDRHCVIVSATNYAQELIDFHKKISEDDFIQLQIDNRNLWLTKLNREGYFNEIYHVFKNNILT